MNKFPLGSYTSESPLFLDGNPALDSYCPGDQDGTQINPYIIEDLDIWSSTGQHGIEIRNINAHLIIRNTLIHNSFELYAGIKLVNCANVNITGCSTDDYSWGILLENSYNNSISDSNCSNGVADYASSGGAQQNGAGILAINSHNNTIQDNLITLNGQMGLILVDSKDNVITGNTVTLSDFGGTYLVGSDRNIFEGNLIASNGVNYGWSESGMRVEFSHQNSFIENQFNANGENGVILEDSNENNFIENNFTANSKGGMHLVNSNASIFTGNSINESFKGVTLVACSENQFYTNKFTASGFLMDESCDGITIDTTNTVNLKPVRYFEDEIDVSLSGEETGQVILFSCQGGLIEGLEISDVPYGISVLQSEAITVRGNNCTDNAAFGINARKSEFVIIIDNYVKTTGSPGAGIYFEQSNNCTAENNFVEGQTIGIGEYFGINNTIKENLCLANKHGIALEYTNGSYVMGNNCSLNEFAGIYLDFAALNLIVFNSISNSSFHGICLLSSERNAILGNNCTSNIIGLSTNYAYNNIFAWNNFTANNYSLILFDSTGNLIHSNNFVSSTLQHVVCSNTNNTWTFEGQGNYWDNYTGADADMDGIGDTPFIIEGGTNNDTAPLLSPSIFPLEDYIRDDPLEEDDPPEGEDPDDTDQGGNSPEPSIPGFPPVMLGIFGIFGILTLSSIVLSGANRFKPKRVKTL